MEPNIRKSMEERLKFYRKQEKILTAMLEELSFKDEIPLERIDYKEVDRPFEDGIILERVPLTVKRYPLKMEYLQRALESYEKDIEEIQTLLDDSKGGETN